MPILTDEEMAAVLDPALLNPVADDDEDEAVRSQLMASIEQNRTAFAANMIEPSIEVQSILNGDIRGTQSRDDRNRLQSGAKRRDRNTGQSSPLPRTPTDTNGGPNIGERRQASQQPHEHGPIPLGTQGEETGIREDGAAATEQEDEDFKSASSRLVGNHTAGLQPESESEQDVGDLLHNSDEEADSCLFCHLEEVPATTTGEEEDLSCAVCRRPAHIACARQNAATADRQSWRCPICSQNRTSASPKENANKARPSAPRLVRDLLPVSRGMQKPGAHSIFAQSLIPDDEGGRALRKRKSLSLEHVPRTEKRKKSMMDSPRPEKIESDVVPHSTRRASQKLASGLPPVPTARVLQHRPFHKAPPHKFILAFKLDQTKIEAILTQIPRPGRRRYNEKKKQKIPAPAPYQPTVPKFPALPTHNLIFPPIFGDRDNEANAKPYGGILSEAEAETSRSLPQMRDREIFENARKEAEEERKKTSAKAEAEMNGVNGEGPNATNSKRTVSGPPSKIKCIQFGKFVIDTSYAAPYPEEYSHESRLFICEFCLKYLPSEFVAWRHKLKCSAKHPPGDEIYRDGSLSIWEVDGRKKTEYCQCLCLMAKLFLGSKTLYYDVDPFLFYVLTEFDELGYHFVGYFSKEKRPASQNNVSCILVMPIHQRKGYATFLIEFSYLLTRIEGKDGSPEKPLSDMGLTAYRSYWDLTISRHLLNISNKPFSVKDMMERTGMTADDVVHSLERLYAFVKDPVSKAYAIRYDKALYEDIVNKYESKDFRQINPERLVWTPYIMGRSDAAALDAQPITAVAQREGDMDEVQDSVHSDHISPKSSKEPSRASPPKIHIDPALVNPAGSIAPGPPPVTAMDNSHVLTAEVDPVGILLSEGDLDEGKANGEDALSGYARTHRDERIPPSRYQIDPPIPAAMLRKTSIRRKSAVGTPRSNGMVNGKPLTPRPVRSSPRKAGSVNGSMAGQGSSRGTSPDKASVSVRRSGRKSGLANEIVTANASAEDEDDDDDEEEEDEDAIMEDEDEDEEDDEEEGDEAGVVTTTRRGLVETRSDGSASDEDESGGSEASSSEGEDGDGREEGEGESNASDEAEAVADEDEEDEEDESNDEAAESEGGAGSDTSSAVGSTDEASENGEED